MTTRHRSNRRLRTNGHLMRTGFERFGARLDALVQGTNKAQTATVKAGDVR